MESERPHRSTSELFICFTSRHSSSSMKVSSKSSLSPGRSTEKFREPTLSLSSSLSRRLRSNGSMKGGQASPMFPTGSKKKGSSFETPEPSSPKVTCIGQVRVKTKKQGKKFRTRSKRRGEVSFRKTEQLQEGGGVFLHSQSQQQQECLPHRNQRWVHLPLSICEALRAFGAEFSCFLPCRSSCLRGEREKSEKRRNRSNATTNSSCGAVFARWLMALQDGEEEKRREVEVLSREKDEKRENRGEVVREMQMQISKEKQVVVCEEIEEEEEEEEEARVSICIPPRNALLLMRCRSEPFRSSALANRFWESPVPKEEDDNEEEDERDYNEDDEEQEAVLLVASGVEKEQVKLETEEEHQEEEMVENPQMEGNPDVPNEEEERNIASAYMQQRTEEEAIMVNESSPEAVDEEEISESEEKPFLQERVELMLVEREDPILLEREEKEAPKEEMEERRASVCSRRVSVSSCTLSVHPEEEEEEPEVESFEERVEKSIEEEEETEKPHERSATETEEEEEEEEPQKAQDLQFLHRDEEESDSDSVLPDCLLLMMCEPKLSMEVSKETWVCSTDFIRYRPERKGGGNQKIDSGNESKKRLSTDSNPGLPPQHPGQNKHHQHQHHHQPPRRSFSSKPTPPVTVAVAVAAPPLAPPAAAASSMATMIEQKLVNAVGYEPFVLTRCKSEPMRSSAKLAPEACFWKNMKLEPHGPTTLGVGATGIGF